MISISRPTGKARSSLPSLCRRSQDRHRCPRVLWEVESFRRDPRPGAVASKCADATPDGVSGSSLLSPRSSVGPEGDCVRPSRPSQSAARRKSSPGAGAGSAARPGVRDNRVRGADLHDPPVGRAALIPPAAARAGLSGSGLGRVRAGPCLRPGPNRGSSVRSFGVFPAG